MIDLHKYFTDQNMIRGNDRSPIRVMGFQRTHLYSLYHTLGYTKGAEIGVRWGKNAIDMCEAIPSLDLIAIDPWCDYSDVDKILTDEKHERMFKKAQTVLAPYNITFMRMKSMDAVVHVQPESLDFIYIDGNHCFDYIMEDLIEWTRKVRKDGMISGHDFCHYRKQQVVEAVQVYTTAHQYEIDEIFLTDEQAPSFFWRKL